MNKPIQMRFWIGGYGSTEYELTYDGIYLQYHQFNLVNFNLSDAKETISADANDWEAFALELDMIGVWDWKPRYEAEVMDGTQWAFKIEWRYRRLNIYGSNCYPESEGSPSVSSDYTRSFIRFLNALSQLAGGRRID